MRNRAGQRRAKNEFGAVNEVLSVFHIRRSLLEDEYPLGQKSKTYQVLGSQELGTGQEEIPPHVTEIEKSPRNEFQPQRETELGKKHNELICPRIADRSKLGDKSRIKGKLK